MKYSTFVFAFAVIASQAADEISNTDGAEIAMLRQLEEGDAPPPPKGVFMGKTIRLPPFGSGVALPRQGSYTILDRAAYQPVPFDDWTATEFLEPLGYVYRRETDGMEYVVTADTTRPIVRQDMTLPEALAKLVPQKEESAAAVQDRFVQAFDGDKAAYLFEYCDAKHGAREAAEPMCVAKDIWMAMMKTKETDGGMRVMQADLSYKDALDITDAVHTVSEHESQGFAPLVFSAIKDLLSTPLEVLRGVLSAEPLEPRQLTDNGSGKVLGVLASTDSDGILTFLDGTLSRVWESTAQAEVHLPLETLQQWSSEVNRALSHVEAESKDKTPEVSDFVKEPLIWLKKEISVMANRHPDHPNNIHRRELAKDHGLGDYGPLNDFVYGLTSRADNDIELAHLINKPLPKPEPTECPEKPTTAPCGTCPHKTVPTPRPHHPEPEPCPHKHKEEPCPHKQKEEPCPHKHKEEPCPHKHKEEPCPHKHTTTSTHCPHLPCPTPAPGPLTHGFVGRHLRQHIILKIGQIRGLSITFLDALRLMENVCLTIAREQQEEAKHFPAPITLPVPRDSCPPPPGIFVHSHHHGILLSLVPDQIHRLLHTFVHAKQAIHHAHHHEALRKKYPAGVPFIAEDTMSADDKILSVLLGLPGQALQGVTDVLGGAGGLFLDTINSLTGEIFSF